MELHHQYIVFVSIDCQCLTTIIAVGINITSVHGQYFAYLTPSILLSIRHYINTVSKFMLQDTKNFDNILMNY